ncbi:MAG: GNAT family N-acetyltransferase [Ruminiclostridium sp.]|nr:GNAT family N-acetyltransferase [Ruminiclostridium sp.]
MITIEKGDIGLYCKQFEKYRTDFTDKCAESAARHGHILIAYLEGTAAGYLLTSAEHGSEFIMYVFTLPELRGKGVMQSLIREAVGISDGYIGTAFTDIHEFAPVLMHVMKKCGFEQRGSKFMFRCDGDDLWDRWDAYMEKSGNRLCNTLRRQGYSTVLLSDASEELLKQYRNTPNSEYANPLNHQHLILPGAEITKDVSVMCVRNGILSAYVFAYMPDRYSAVFKTLSSSAALHGTGVILLPIAEALRKVRERGCEQFVFSMDGIGDRANSFRNKVLSVLISKTSQRISYIYKKKDHLHE